MQQDSVCLFKLILPKMEKRYMPQIRISEIGQDGQKRLRESHVLIVGCGALGSPVSMLLAGAGIGSITIADFDLIEISNLHRQVFYKEVNAGFPKVDILLDQMKELNSEISIYKIQNLITSKFLQNNTVKYDLIVDAADNPATTYLLSDFCVERAIPLLTAGVIGWEAQIFTFIPGSASYSDIFGAPKNDSGILPCSIEGILGPTSMFAASIQASEAIKILLGLSIKGSQLITADLFNSKFNVIPC